MIAQFWIGAAVLSLGALAFVVVPLWRERRRSGNWSRLGSVAAALLVPSAVLLYAGIGTWNGQPVSAPATMPAMAKLVEGLDARLQEQPDDPAGWYLLGQSYMSLSRFADARRAFREALARNPALGLELKLALGEAEVLTDPQSLAGQAGQIFEEALQVEPDNPTALWYGGLAAAATQRPDVARGRWSRLLQLDPPDALRNVLQQHLEALGGAVAEEEEPLRLAQSEPPAGLQITLRISLAAGLDGAGIADNPATSLFIFARAPEGGPPVAAISDVASAIPGEFSLSDANSMLPGRSLADFEALIIVARLSVSGRPTEQRGDLYGELLYRLGEGSGALELVIDQVVE